MFGNTLHQLEYQLLQKGFELGLSKEQIGNVFKNQGELEKIKASPLEVLLLITMEIEEMKSKLTFSIIVI